MADFIKATIDLKAIQKNYEMIAKFCYKETITSVVLKDNAYGLGAVRISLALYDVGCRDFWVAYLKEALNLRDVLPHDANIYYLQGFQESDLPIIKNAKIVPVVNSLVDFKKVVKNNIEFVIQVDTGLSRLGLRSEDIDILLPVLESERVAYVISHLACSDEKDSLMNLKQKRSFDKILEKIRGRIDVKAGIAATGGIFLGKDYVYDMVRIGSFLYNIQINSSIDLENVLTLEAKVLQKYILSSDNTVGYGATYRTERDTKVAIVSIGYGDGLKRNLANKGIIGFYGKENFYKVPIIGNVSMDLTACDVSTVPDELTMPGSFAVILSKDYSIKDMAKDAKAIPSEILTGINFLSNRFSLNYLD